MGAFNVSRAFVAGACDLPLRRRDECASERVLFRCTTKAAVPPVQIVLLLYDTREIKNQTNTSFERNDPRQQDLPLPTRIAACDVPRQTSRLRRQSLSRARARTVSIFFFLESLSVTTHDRALGPIVWQVVQPNSFVFSFSFLFFVFFLKKIINSNFHPQIRACYIGFSLRVKTNQILHSGKSRQFFLKKQV